LRIHAAADYIANCRWLTEAEVDVYATEYGRTVSPARCRAIAYAGLRFQKYRRDAHLFGPHHRRAIAILAGKAIGASTKRRARSTRCAIAPARIWSDFI